MRAARATAVATALLVGVLLLLSGVLVGLSEVVALLRRLLAVLAGLVVVVAVMGWVRKGTAAIEERHSKRAPGAMPGAHCRVIGEVLLRGYQLASAGAGWRAWWS